MVGIMSAEEFQKINNVSRETMDKFICYSEMLIKWQKAINLVSDNSLSDMWRRHFYDSAQLIEYIDQKKQPLKILDLGSGAGFPGLVLSILGAGEVHLIEGVGKKCSFMKQIIQKTKIDAIVHNERIENMDAFPVDLITSRACADLGKLLSLTSKFMTPDTKCLFLKGEKAQDEIERAKRSAEFKVDIYKSKSEETGMILSLSQIRLK
ncbi:MAG: 16S rRNA (guanine(527)-N(7))-methyltransferase RsmG [Emcibacteraceae bacterium]|nr:16S rRNA (guanine(527)-N(7))-methyltransferase RsmG [Emcibacteraceae bacterium]